MKPKTIDTKGESAELTDKATRIEEQLDLDELAALLPEMVDKEQFCRDIIDTVIWLDLALSDRNKAGQTDVRKELRSIHRKLKSVADNFEKLDAKALDSISRRAGNQGRFPLNEAKENRLAGGCKMRGQKLGEWRIERCRIYMEELERWIADAIVLNNPGLGNRRQPEADIAMHSLIDAWEEQTGRRPTIVTEWQTGRKMLDEPFFQYCEKILRPVFEKHNRKVPELGGLAQRNLYPTGGKN